LLSGKIEPTEFSSYLRIFNLGADGQYGTGSGGDRVLNQPGKRSLGRLIVRNEH